MKIKNTGPNIFNAIAIEGSHVDDIQRYDWFEIDENEKISSRYCPIHDFISPNSSTIIIYLTNQHCDKLEIDRGLAVKYDGVSMELVDKATVDKIINL